MKINAERLAILAGSLSSPAKKSDGEYVECPENEVKFAEYLE